MHSQSEQLNREVQVRLSIIQKQIQKKFKLVHEIKSALQKQQCLLYPLNKQCLLLQNINIKQPQQNNNIQISSLDDIQSIPIPIFSSSVDYYQCLWRLFIKNQILIKQVRSISDKNKQLENVVNEVERLSQLYSRQYKLKNRKKNRRSATEIQKNFTCPYENCRKVYGSDVSLNLHIKLKHNGGNKTDREKLAEEICQAEQRNQQMPPMTLNLPPGFLNEYRKLYFQKDYENSQEENNNQDQPNPHNNKSQSI